MLAQVVNLAGPWSIGSILIAVIVLAAAIAVVYVALQAFGVTPPPWAVKIFWIVLVAFVAVVALKILFGL